MAERPYWTLLFDDFVAQSETAKLKARLNALESAIYERMQEIEGTPDSDAERRAIEAACKKLLEIKTRKLGFPPIPTFNSSRTDIQQ